MDDGHATQDIIPEVQGLRGLCVAAVVLFHMGWLWFGWLGVWAFFVISGFVITRALIRRDDGRSSVRRLGDFYRNRASRILPLVLFAVALGVATLCFKAFVFRRPEELRFLADLPWLMTGLYNFERALPGHEHTRLFGHLWSLALEEQFYLLFPLAFLFLRRVALVALLVTVWLSGPVIRAGLHLYLADTGWTPSQIATAAYHLPFGHFDGFALGALIALAEGRIRALRGTSAGSGLLIASGIATAALGLACVGQAWDASVSWSDRLTGPFVLKPETVWGQVLVYAFATTGAGLLLLVVLVGSPLSPLLRAYSLVQLGSISFSVYVFHFPLLWLYTDAGVRSVAGALVYFAAVAAAGVLSHRYVELPARDWIRAWRPGRAIDYRTA